jgi:hypothetical protein
MYDPSGDVPKAGLKLKVAKIIHGSVYERMERTLGEGKIRSS